MKSEVLKFLKSFIICLLGFLLADGLLGIIGDYFIENLPKTGTRISQQYLANKEVTADIIILGSSRANHHYNAPMMSEELQLSVYNTGIDGCGLHYNNCVLHNVLKRKIPKLVVFELDPFLLTGMWKERLKKDLGIYYFKDDYIKNTLNEIEDSSFPLKIRINAYRFNNIFISLFNTYCVNKNVRPLGYAPLEPNSHDFKIQYHDVESFKIDSTVYKSFLDMIQWSKLYNFKLIVVESPKLIVSNSNTILKQICTDNNITYFDNSNLDFIINNSHLFNDPTHLNKKGADVYTQYFMKQIKKYL